MSYPSPAELWAMPIDDFNKWRRENDLKYLFECFQKSLFKFDEWLKENNLTIDFILQTDMPGQFFYWQKETFLAKTLKGDSTSYFFRPIENERDKKRLLKNQAVKYEGETTELFRFKPYFYWVKEKYNDDKPIKSKSKYSSDMDTFRFMGGVAPDVPEMCSASISPGVSVLKLGGTKINGWHRLNYVNLDFTNLDFLEIEGKDSWSREIQICYSSCRNIKATNAVANFTKFYQCHFTNLNVINSRFYGIEFYNCDLFKAYFENSSISNLFIDNCSANSFSFNRVEVENIEYTPPKEEWHCGLESTYETVKDNYKRFRILYQANGLRQEASEAYYLERIYELKYNLRSLQVLKSFKSLWKDNIDYSISYLKYNLKKFLRIISDSISYFIWGFGERPMRILSTSFLVLTLYACIYYFSDISKLKYDLVNSYYLSIVTFTTLGFGDITPIDNNTYKLVVGSEALIGAFCMGLLVAGYANKSKY